MLRLFIMAFGISCATLTVSAQHQWDILSGPRGGDIVSMARNSRGVVLATDEFSIFSTNDSGHTWTKIFSRPTRGIVPGKLLVNSKDVFFLEMTAESLYKSEDEGKTWLPVCRYPYPYWDSWGTVIVDSADVFYFDTYGSGTFKSTDEGRTWSLLGMVRESVTSLCVVGEYVYAATMSNGLWRTSDGGGHWEQRPNIHGYETQLTFVGGMLFAVSLTSSEVSLDSGTTWSQIIPDHPASFYPGNVIFSGGVLYLTQPDSGVWASTDAGKTWTRILPAIPITELKQLVELDGYLIGGTDAGAMYRSRKSDSMTWEETEGIYSAGVGNLLFTPDGSLFNMGWQILSRSTDNGKSWVRLPIDLRYTSFPGDILQNTDGSLWVRGRTVLARSTDHGDSWTYLPDGGTISIAHDSKGTIYRGCGHGAYRQVLGDTTWVSMISDSTRDYYNINIYIDSHDRIYALSGLTGALNRSTDYGKTWQRFPASLGHARGVNNLLEVNDSVLLGGTNGAGVWQSFDHGESWIYEFGNGYYPDANGIAFVQCLALAPDGSVVMSIGKSGMYRSTDGGWWWSVLDTTEEAVSFAFDKEGYMYVGAGTALLKSKSPLLTVESQRGIVPERLGLFQNYPNPFNPTTEIGYRIADLGLVTLKIYNILGQVVATLVNEVKPPGEYLARWSAAGGAGGMPSGVYFYKLTAGKFSEVRKMVLAR